MLRVRRVVLVLCGSALGWPSMSAAQTLSEALASAYASNPGLVAERARYRAVREQKNQAIAGALPSIEGSGSLGRLNDTTTFNASTFQPGAPRRKIDSTLDPIAVQVDADQPLFTGFRNLNAIRAAAARVRAGGAELASAEQSLLLRAATAYFDVLRDEQIYAANVNQASVLSRQAEEARARLAVGEVTRTDVAQAEARLSQARAGVSVAQSNLAATRAAFAEVIGAPPGELEQSPPLPETPATLDAALEAARALSPTVVAARERADAARRQVAIAKGAFSPSVSFGATYAHSEDQSTLLVRSDQLSWGLRARVPIFTGGLNLSRVREARANEDAARASVDEAERRAVAETTAAYGRLVAARQTVEAARAQVDANRIALEGVRREREVGARTNLNVLDAEQEVLNAETTLAEAERDGRAATFALLAATGALTRESAGVAPAP